MGKHKLMKSSEQMFFAPFKKNKDSNSVDSVDDQTRGKRLYPQDQFDNNAKSRVCCTTPTQTTTPKSFVFPANYTLHGKFTTETMQKSNGLALSPSCLFPSKKHDKKIDISVSSHSFNTERKKDEKLVRRKAVCRREYGTSRQKQSGRLLSGSKTSKSKPVSQSPTGVNSLLSLIEKTMKEISALHKRQQTLCNKQQSYSVQDNANDGHRFQGFQVDPDQTTSGNETMWVDDTEE